MADGPGAALGTILMFLLIVGIGPAYDWLKKVWKEKNSAANTAEPLENNSKNNYIINRGGK